MKKIFLSLMALAAALSMASCSNDEGAAHSGDLARVSFKISLGDAAATRATTFGDGTKCDLLVWEVYDAEGDVVAGLSNKKENAFNGGHTETVDFMLAKGQTYTFAFWAQNSACTDYVAYTEANGGVTTNLENISISYNGAGNDESRDAFFGNTQPIQITGDLQEDIHLYRPFAQLNLAASDLTALETAGIQLGKVKIVVSNVATALDARTGKVYSPDTDVTFSLADVLCYKTDSEDNKTLELKYDVNGIKEFPWIAMNYLLVNDPSTGKEGATANVTFTLTTQHADIVLYSSNTPLQRNWRTNVIAQLTNTRIFNIIIEPDFDDEVNVPLD